MKRLLSLALFILIVVMIRSGAPLFFEWSRSTDPLVYDASQKESVTIIDDSFLMSIQKTNAKTVDELLHEFRKPIQKDDFIWPEKETPLFSGMTITIQRGKTIKIETKEGRRQVQTTRFTGEQVLSDNNIFLDENDISLPDAAIPLTNNTSLKVIRVVLEDQLVNKPIPFEKIVNEDEKLSWRKNVITQKGVPGTRQSTYRVTSYDGKEISRKLIDSQVTTPPATEISTQGTYVQVGKASLGLGSWYAFTGTLSAANPWLPLGSYARVTNQDNGKQVIVKINDRGPFGKNRIIDLDRVAFEKIASIGAGIINVKLEPITN